MLAEASAAAAVISECWYVCINEYSYIMGICKKLLPFVVFVIFISIYENTPSEHLVNGVTAQRTISLQKVNFPDTGKQI